VPEPAVGAIGSFGRDREIALAMGYVRLEELALRAPRLRRL
jgi:hypothetical protein